MSKNLVESRQLASTHVSELMKLSAGRDRITALIQYCIQFYQITLTQRHKVKSRQVARTIRICKRIEKSLSNSRKMLRFLKCILGVQNAFKYINEVFLKKL